MLCNKVSLSYDQEERVRSFQQSLLQRPETWLEVRHLVRVYGQTLDSTHCCLNGMSERTKKKESEVLDILTTEQRIKFLAWARRKRDAIHQLLERQPEKTTPNNIKISSKYHNTTNLYIIDNKFKSIMKELPPAPSPVSSHSVKGLSRQPSFESLASASGTLTRENSSSSLKRTLSGGEGEDGDTHMPSIHLSPEDAQAAALPLLIEALRPAGIVPESVFFQSSHTAETDAEDLKIDIPNPTPVYKLQTSLSQQNMMMMNVVPEDREYVPSGTQTAEDFLFELSQDDWAIGGFNIEMPDPS